MFLTADSTPLPIENDFKGQSCFLILSGPSLNTIDLEKLTRPGIITFGINNSPKKFRPDLWTMGDEVGNFMISIWMDPKIKKLVPIAKATHDLFDNTTWKQSHLKVKDCPNVVYFERNDNFNHETFLTEPTINWGCSRELGGCRSVMLMAVRIIHLLGFNKLFLLGCDFKMDESHKYAFPQDRSPGSIYSNNSAYKKLNERFTLLRPVFEKAGFYVFNSTPDSGLKAFDYVPFDAALKIATKDFPDTITERSEGMYDREAKLREIERQKSRTVLYYNAGNSYLTRLAVSISSLRNVYTGNTTILCDAGSFTECSRIAKYFSAECKAVDFSMSDRNTRLFNKTVLHQFTSYPTNLYLDADTLVVKDPGKLFKAVEANEFVVTQFADWTPKTTVVEKRIREWKDIMPIDKAMEYPYAINTGVFAFTKDSGIMKAWFNAAVKGADLFIPDEISCQVLLPDFKHFTANASFNTSCKYGRMNRKTKIIHYHGNKHCRIADGKYLFHSDLWYREFDRIKHLDFVKDNIQFDNKLMENIGAHI